jgi:hypothetical protein
MTVENAIFKSDQHIFWNIDVWWKRSSVDNTKSHTSLDGVIEESAVHTFAKVLESSKRERQVAHSAADIASRAFSKNSTVMQTTHGTNQQRIKN